MTFSLDTFDWPTSPAEWLIWVLVMVSVFVVLRRSAGVPTGVLGVAIAMLGYSVDRHYFIPLTMLLAGVVYLVSIRTPNRSLGIRIVLRQLMYIGVGFTLYELGRKVTEGEEPLALSNSARVLDFEQRLKLNFEPTWQGWVLPHDFAVTLSTRVYSSLYIPVVLGGIVWFLLTSPFSFRVLRNALCISAIFSVLTFWLYPVAPPRLLPAANIVDLHSLIGRQHGFVNEFAAVPSLHVGWTTLVGYIAFRTYRKSRWRFLAWLPGVVMLVTVIVTGNHYWFDGAIGILYSLVPAAILFEWPEIRAWWIRWISPSASRPLRPMATCVVDSKWALANTIALGSLLVFMIVARLLDPGFTGYWGYMVAQIAGTILAVGWLTQRFEREGGLSAFTHVIIAVVTYADTLGTAAHYYAKYGFYDKITHFGGGLILAATAFEIFLALDVRGALRVSLPWRMLLSVGVSVGLGAFWEFYELFGDAIFDTGRHAGSHDTIFDLISDTAGAIAAVIVLGILEPRRTINEPEQGSTVDPVALGQFSEAPRV